MTILSRLMSFAAIVALAYFIFFWKQREVTIEVPAPAPQVAPQVTPQPPARSQPRPRPTPQPGQLGPTQLQPQPQPQSGAFEPESGQPAFRVLQSPQQTPQIRRERRPALYDWEPAFNTALMETDQSKRQDRIAAAQSAIDKRLHELDGQDAPLERRAIENAEAGLNVLQSQTNGQFRKQ